MTAKAKRLTPDQEKGKTPAQKFGVWCETFPDELERLRLALGYEDREWWTVFRKEAQRAREWLESYAHSSKARKKDWYRFLKNWIPMKGEGKNGKGRNQDRNSRRSPGKFDRDSGEYNL